MIAELKVSAGWNNDANSLAGRLLHYKMAPLCTTDLSDYLGSFAPYLDDGVRIFMTTNMEILDNMIQRYVSGEYEVLKGRGFLSATRFYDTYVFRKDGKYESVPHMFLRISAFCAYYCIQSDCLFKALQYTQQQRGIYIKTGCELVQYFFHMISTQIVCCATPVMRSAGLKDQNLSSCFIVAPKLYTEENTVQAVFSDLTPLLASKSGVGFDLTTYSHGKSLSAILKAMDGQVTYFNDNNIRPVSVATYLEIWHYQIMDFLTIKLPENPERCSNLFQGICVPDIFFRSYVENPDGDWYLFDPKDVPQLIAAHGVHFDSLYTYAVQTGRYVETVPLKSIMFALISCIIKTGGPYVLSKEAMNTHDWHAHDTVGYPSINCANLCAEVIQLPGENVSTCNLANICLPNCLTVSEQALGTEYLYTPDLQFSFELLERAVEAAVFIINSCIYGGQSPTEKVRRGQLDRSMGIGIQGLADTFAMLRMGYFDTGSELLDVDIAEKIYYTAVSTSVSITKHGKGAPFAGYHESLYSIGVLHWFNWENCNPRVHSRDEWDKLAHDCETFGVYNSQFVAYMPTAGTGQLTGYSDAFYPFYAAVSSKVSNKEEIMRPNRCMLRDMCPRDIMILRECNWEISQLPPTLLDKYRIYLTAFDFDPKDYIRRARARAPFIDQSQSMTLFVREEHAQSASHLKDLLVYGWKMGLKTLMYYCRIKKTATSNEFECVGQVPTVQKEMDVTPGEGGGVANCQPNCIKPEQACAQAMDTNFTCLSCQ